MKNGYDFSFTDPNGQSISLSKFRGKVTLVVNTASECGFTPQYNDLEELATELEAAGLIVIAVPSNDFGKQEPLSGNQIISFCSSHRWSSFVITEKTSVTGHNAHPFYVWAGEQAGAKGAPSWNFHKYLLGKDGNLIGWFPSAIRPTSSEIRMAIEKAL